MVQGQAIEVATQISEQLVSQSSSHGILGLGFGNINTVTPTQVKTPLENMILQKDIPASQELFTCYLGSYKDVNNTDKGESFFTFGGIAEDVVQSAGQEITYTPVDSSHGFWKISSESMVVNGQTFPQPGGTAIVDTGTTLVLISDEMVNAIYAVIPGAVYSERDQGWVFPADIPSEQLPVVSFAVGETQIAIEQEQLGFTPANKTGMVFGGIQSRGSLEYNILGDTFFKCVYAVSHSIVIVVFLCTNGPRSSTKATSNSGLFNVSILLRTSPRLRSADSKGQGTCAQSFLVVVSSSDSPERH